MLLTARLLGLGALLVLCHLPQAIAQDWPRQTVTFVVPYEPGGGNDAGTRFLAEKLGQQLKQTFVVVNRAGMSGISGSQYVSDMKPDGYTLLEAADTETSAPFILPNVTFDLERDLTPISKIGSTPFVWTINPKAPANNPKELLDFIKQHPTQFRWGVGGIGTPGDLAIEKINRAAGINPMKVPYKGNGPAVIALLSGEVDGMLASPPAVQSLVEAGKLKTVAVVSLKPLESFPGVPTLASFGFPGLEAGSWFGIWGPKGMPQELVMRIQTAIANAMADPDLQKKFAGAGIFVDVSKSPSEFAAYIRSNLESNRTLIRELKLNAAP